MRTSRSNTIAICVTVAVTTSITACGDDGGSDPSEASDIPDRFRAFSSQFELERQALGIPGAAVAILEHGELTFAHGFGTKGIASSEPVDAATLFRVGSMGKVVTSIGVLSAVDEGLLKLDVPIRDAIPDLSLQGPESERLSLRQLLSQQSGLRDYIAIPGPSDDAGLAAFTSGPELAENVDFMNPPGLFWNYSNPNFYLAGRALEAQAQTTYRDAIDERVFAPLQMDRSFFLAEDVIADGDYTNGYGVNDVEGDGEMEDLAPDAYENTWARPAGFAFSNVLDWTHLMQFLMAGDSSVISDAAHEELVAPQISTHSIYADVKEIALGLGDSYGFGVGVSDGFFMDRRGEPDTYYAVPYIGHGGDIPGFATTFAVFPSTGFGIVVLSNRDALRPVDSIRFALESFGGLPAPSAPPPGLRGHLCRRRRHEHRDPRRGRGRQRVERLARQPRLSVRSRARTHQPRQLCALDHARRTTRPARGHLLRERLGRLRLAALPRDRRKTRRPRADAGDRSALSPVYSRPRRGLAIARRERIMRQLPDPGAPAAAISPTPRMPHRASTRRSSPSVPRRGRP
jgi:CubicO group peptidase (beta-lactamase class C family)